MCHLVHNVRSSYKNEIKTKLVSDIALVVDFSLAHTFLHMIAAADPQSFAAQIMEPSASTSSSV